MATDTGTPGTTSTPDDEEEVEFNPDEHASGEKGEELDEAECSDFDQDDPNLVTFFRKTETGRHFLKDWARVMMEDIERGWEAASPYRQKIAENNRILTGFLKRKDLPFEGCANAHTPLMLERLLRLEANVFVEIFLDRDTIFGVKPTGADPQDFDNAELLTFHGNWQIQNELTDFLSQHQLGLHYFFGQGDSFCYSYRDSVANRNRHDILGCDDLILPYVHVTHEVDMSDVPWKARKVRKYKSELKDLAASKEWAQVDKVLKQAPPAWDVEPTPDEVRERGAEQEGILPPESDPTAPYQFYEYHGRLRMPGELRSRPICATIDKTTKTITRFYIREIEDWRDRARFDKQLEELQQYSDDLGAYQQIQQHEQELQQTLQHPEIHPQDVQTMQDALAHQPPEPPIMPKWMQPEQDGGQPKTQPDPVRRVPLEMFSHGVCIKNPYGAYGLSFGTVLAELNKLADEGLNRFYDSATLANCWAMLVPQNFDIGSNSIPFGPGRLIRVKNVDGEQLQNMVKELKPAPANPQLFDVVRFADENADSSVAAPGVLSGEPGKSGETFRGLAQRNANATRQLSQAGIMYLRFLEQILRNNAYLNSMFLADEEVIEMAELQDLPTELTDGRPNRVGQPAGQGMRRITVGRDLYRRNYKVTFTADVRFISAEQRASEADQVIGMISQLPPLQQNPALLYAAVCQAFRARGLHSMIRLLGPPPPPPTQPMAPPPPPAPPGGPQGPPPGPGGPPPPTPGGP